MLRFYDVFTGRGTKQSQNYKILEKQKAKMADQQSPITNSKSVRFHSIEIIECPVTIGDNPSVSSGVPITIEWTCQKRTKLGLEFFEKFRPPRRSCMKKLRLKSSQREKLLRKAGHTTEEIDDAIHRAEIAIEQRFETMQELQQAKLKAAHAVASASATKTLAVDIVTDDPTVALLPTTRPVFAAMTGQGVCDSPPSPVPSRVVAPSA